MFLWLSFFDAMLNNIEMIIIVILITAWSRIHLKKLIFACQSVRPLSKWNPNHYFRAHKILPQYTVNPLHTTLCAKESVQSDVVVAFRNMLMSLMRVVCLMLAYHPLSSVHDRLFSILSATHYVWRVRRPSPFAKWGRSVLGLVFYSNTDWAVWPLPILNELNRLLHAMSQHEHASYGDRIDLESETSTNIRLSAVLKSNARTIQISSWPRLDKRDLIGF